MIDDDLNNAERVRNIRIALLLIHGDADDFIPWSSNGQIVYDNATTPKALELVRRANHTDIPWVMGIDQYTDRILQFIRQ